MEVDLFGFEQSLFGEEDVARNVMGGGKIYYKGRNPYLRAKR
jgi:hypothetical protein